MSRRKSRRLMNQINVVPYIDVMLVLLVIFMVTAPMTNPGVVELPQVGQALKQAAAPVVITVKADGRAELDGKVLQRDELLFAVKTQIEQTPDRAIVIAADKNVQYDKVVTLMDSLKQYKVGLLLKPAN
ncbi:protein TolR [Methylobacillus methanolivorans]|uniref:ExbD/TolR family protein n=1 Tax=Methylobacillus methanolivorans TaxID=1848927 RepID=A0ABW8GPY8_9PROT